LLSLLLEKASLKRFLKARARLSRFDSGRLREPWKIVTAILTIQPSREAAPSGFVLSWMTKAHIYGGPAALLTRVPAIYFQMGLPDNGPVDRLSRVVPAAGALTCSEFAANCSKRLFGTAS
jgi:hypothetical protein